MSRAERADQKNQIWNKSLGAPQGKRASEFSGAGRCGVKPGLKNRRLHTPKSTDQGFFSSNYGRILKVGHP